MLHPLPLPLSSCLGCIPPLIGLPSLRFMRLALVCFYCLCVFVYVFHFIATMSFAGHFLSVLFCLLSMLISDSRFDLVWFRLSCDHGWIRSGSVNVRKQQTTTIYYQLSTVYCILYTIYYIPYTIYYILYTIYYVLYTIYYMLYTIYYIIYTIYYILYTINYIPGTIYYIHIL